MYALTHCVLGVVRRRSSTAPLVKDGAGLATVGAATSARSPVGAAALISGNGNGSRLAEPGVVVDGLG